MQISRRSFFRTSALGAAAVAASVALPTELFAIKEPSRNKQPGGPILLNSNENPYGPWPSLIEVMRHAIPQANRYPDANFDALAERIAELHRVAREQALPGCGSGEILRICALAFTGPQKPLITASPTFEALAHYSQVHGAAVRRVALNSKFEHDLERMQPAVNEKAGLIYLCNPNNPTASITPRRDIEAFLKTLSPETYVLIDEAYHHFALSSPDYVSFLDRPVDNPRVIVARTFSKIYGLAGIRVGYAVAAKETIEAMRRHAIFDGVNVVAAECASAALADADGLAAAIRRNESDRDEFMRQSRQRKLNVVPSHANFAMVETGKPVRRVIEHFKNNGVLIGRPFPPMETFARISLGTPEEMKQFWLVWDQMS